MVSVIKTNPAKFYKYARQFSKTSEGIGPLENCNGEIITDDKKMAYILPQPYKSVTSIPRSEHHQENLIRIKFNNIMPDVIFTKSKILKYIKKLNNNSTSEPDGISSLCIKNTGNYIIDALEDIYNQMHNEGYSSIQFRQAWIPPACGRSTLTQLLIQQ